MENEKIEELEEVEEIESKERKKEKKPHAWLITALVVCLMAVCGAFGWLAGVSFYAFHEKTSKPETKPKDKKEEVEKLTEADVKNYLVNLDGFVAYFGAKMPLDTASISNQDLLSYASRNIEKEESKFTKAQVDSVIQDLFGKDHKYTLEDINCFVEGHGALYKYDSTTETFDYAPNHPGHGGGGFVRANINFVDAEKTNDTLTIKTKILYEESCGDVCGPSVKYYDNASNKDPIYTGNETECYQKGNCPKMTEVYPQVEDKLPITSFIFKKQSDGNYGLEKVVIE